MTNLELSFVTENTAGSRLIRWFTHSDFSHVDIILPSGRRLGARMDGGVQVRPSNYADFTTDKRILIPRRSEDADRAYDWLFKQVGKPYDKEGLLTSFLFNRGRSVDWWDENQWWCSELATVFVHRAGIPPCITPASRVAPNDCYIYAGCFANA